MHMNQERFWDRSIGPVCCLFLVLVCFGSVLFSNQQFTYRDAGHYYYPLNKLVQREWDAGRWPLWETEENSGMPLLGNPTAAVLYLGKLIFACVPYPIAAKLYVVAHVILAFAAMSTLLRSLSISRAGAAIGAITYGFGAPVLFQYCNIIFLVGAAWLPLGFHAVDRWLRAGRRTGLVELAFVLTMQILGGDPQSAYLLVLSAAGYAVQLARLGTRERPIRSINAPEGDAEPHRSTHSIASKRNGAEYLLTLTVAVAWFASTVVLAIVLPRLRPGGEPSSVLPWMRWAPHLIVLGWLVFALTWWHLGRLNDRSRRLLLAMLSGLLGSVVLSLGLGAAQILPVAEFVGQSNRVA